MADLKDVTPASQQNNCWPLPGCPAIFEQGSHYIIVGREEDVAVLGIRHRVAAGETAISVPKALIDDRQL